MADFLTELLFSGLKKVNLTLSAIIQKTLFFFNVHN
jgi:hypothetical protein